MTFLWYSINSIKAIADNIIYGIYILLKKDNKTNHCPVSSNMADPLNTGQYRQVYE